MGQSQKILKKTQRNNLDIWQGIFERKAHSLY